MGMRLCFNHIRDGEEPLSAVTTTAYPAGAPLRVITDGLALCTGILAGYVGCALSTRANAAASGGGQASYFPGAGKVEMFDNSANDANDVAPYDTALTYAVGNLLYVDNTGKWSNSTPGTGVVDAAAIARGKVVRVVTAGVGGSFRANMFMTA